VDDHFTVSLARGAIAFFYEDRFAWQPDVADAFFLWHEIANCLFAIHLITVKPLASLIGIMRAAVIGLVSKGASTPALISPAAYRYAPCLPETLK
jgi:hypothetical protein